MRGILDKASLRTLREGEVSRAITQCPHARECPGCPLIDKDYSEQLTLKRTRVVGALKNYAPLASLYVEPVQPADQTSHYRTRAKLRVSPAASIGLHSSLSLSAGADAVVDIPECQVLSPRLSATLQVLRQAIRAADGTSPLLTPFREGGTGQLRGVELREVSDGAAFGVLLLLQMVGPEPALGPLAAEAAQLANRIDGLIGIATQFSKPESTPDVPSAAAAPSLIVELWGTGVAPDVIGSARHLSSFGAFASVHRTQAAKVHGRVIRAFDDAIESTNTSVDQIVKPRRVLDLYGGSGALSIALSKRYSVQMVEASARAAEHARLCTQEQGLDVRVINQSVEDALVDLLAKANSSDDVIDGIVLDPPKRGVSPLARERIVRLMPQVIVYLSTDPHTLARDADHFARLGYPPVEMFPIDIAPLTAEVQTACILRPGPPAAPAILYEDDDLLVFDKAAHESVLADEAYASSLMGRASRLVNTQKLLVLLAPPAGQSGLCVMAKHEAAFDIWSGPMKSARLIYLVAVRGHSPTKGTINRELSDRGAAQPARTRFRRLTLAGGHSIVRAIPGERLTHQVQRHFASAGHPVLGDARYGHEPTNRFFEERHGLDRSFIHLVRVEVQDGPDGPVRFEAPLSGDLRTSLQRLGGTEVVDQLERKGALGTVRENPVQGPVSQSLLATPNGGCGPASTAYPVSTPSDGPGPPLDEAPRTLRRPIFDNDDDGL